MRYGLWRVIAITAFALSLAPASARADDDFYSFRSAVPTPGNTCIDVPGGQFQPGTHLQLWQCTRAPNQAFGYESQNNITAGGLCLDGLSGNRGQPPGAGDPVVLAECDGSDHQVWELQPFDANPSEVAIVDPAGLCVAVDGPAAAPRTALVLAQCDQVPNQGWLNGAATRPVAVNGQGGYGNYAESEYYWLGGHRYCWYDGGWHGGGWYWCGYNHNNGAGWGGPIGWHFWFHHGHKFFPHPVFFKGFHGKQGHPHGPGGGHGPGGPGPVGGSHIHPHFGAAGGGGGGGTGNHFHAHVGGGGGGGGGTPHAHFVAHGGGGGGPIHSRFAVHTGGGGGGHPGGGGGHPHGGGGKGGGGGKHKSDIRLKQDIVPLARLDDGIELYRFRYKGSDPTTYVGVMAQEVQEIVPRAVSRGSDGYLQVDYDRLGLRFMTWDEWTQRHGAMPAPAP
jgi:Ricin-type beta-trefoil lectin domain/Chaperone of endosialidase